MHTLGENTRAFQRLKIMPRVLKDVETIDTKVQLFGKTILSPICIAPTAMHKMAHPSGELGTAKAAFEENTCMILSSLSSTSIEVCSWKKTSL